MPTNTYTSRYNYFLCDYGFIVGRSYVRNFPRLLILKKKIYFKIATMFSFPCTRIVCASYLMHLTEVIIIIDYATLSLKVNLLQYFSQFLENNFVCLQTCSYILRLIIQLSVFLLFSLSFTLCVSLGGCACIKYMM